MRSSFDLAAVRTRDSLATVTPRRAVFRLAGYVFTYRRPSAEARVRIDMWREDPSGERHWVSVAACAPTRESARSVALALVAWVQSCDVGPRRDTQAQAVAESFALLAARLALIAPDTRGSVRTQRAPTRLDVFDGTRAASA